MPVDDRFPNQPPPHPPPEPGRQADGGVLRAAATAALAGDQFRAALDLLAAAPAADAAQAEAMARAIAALREAARSQDDFLHASAPDLRNPLAAARGHVQLLGRRARRFALPPAEAERLAAGLAAIDAAIGRTASLVDRLIDASWVAVGPDDDPPASK